MEVPRINDANWQGIRRSSRDLCSAGHPVEEDLVAQTDKTRHIFSIGAGPADTASYLDHGTLDTHRDIEIQPKMDGKAAFFFTISTVR